jgi:hypothetical protein
MWSRCELGIALQALGGPGTIHPNDDTVPDNRWSRIMKSRCNALDAARREAQRLRRQSRAKAETIFLPSRSDSRIHCLPRQK